MFIFDGVHFVEDIEQIPLSVNACALNARHDLTDDFLACCSIGTLFERFKIWQKPIARPVWGGPSINEIDKCSQCSFLQLFALPALRFILGIGEERGIVWCSPVLPAVVWFERRGKLGTNSLSFISLTGFSLIKDAQKEYPRQLWD